MNNSSYFKYNQHIYFSNNKNYATYKYHHISVFRPIELWPWQIDDNNIISFGPTQSKYYINHKLIYQPEDINFYRLLKNSRPDIGFVQQTNLMAPANDQDNVHLRQGVVVTNNNLRYNSAQKGLFNNK